MRGIVEEILSKLLEVETKKLMQVTRYKHSKTRRGYRNGHYDRKLTTTFAEAGLNAPGLKGQDWRE